jgi:CubicO group peptidase (beta-lactamase class C family)
VVRRHKPAATWSRYGPFVGALSALTGQLSEELARWRAPALEVAVVRADEVLLADGFGSRDLRRALPATPRTLFHHGSTGKAFTGVLAAMLVDDGLLDWDRPVRDFLPELRLHDPVMTERITLVDLLSHRSGLARHDLSWVLNPGWSADELARRLRHLEPAADLRAKFGYSNYGYLLVGQLIAQVTGSSWDEQMRKRVLEPFGMARTQVSVTATETTDDHARPYAVRADRPVEVAYRQSDPIAPAGGVMSCAIDTTRWLRFQLSGGVLDGQRLLSEPALARTQAMRVPFGADLDPDPEIRYDGYAMGWLVGTYRGRRMLWHNGGIDGFYTEIMLLPEAQVGALTCANTHPSLLPTAALYATVDTVLGESDAGWFDRKFEQYAAQRAGERQAAARARVVPDTAPAHPLAEYTGRYEHPGYGAIDVTVGPGRSGTDLDIQVGSTRMTARHRHFDTWEFHYEQLEESFPVTFVTDADGFVAEAVVPFEPAVAPIRFRRRPDPTLTDPGFLAGLVGRYRLGEHVLSVQLADGGRLVAELPRIGPVPLEPGLGRSFTAAGLPGVTIEFTVDEGGVRDVVTPFGVFVPEGGS